MSFLFSALGVLSLLSTAYRSPVGASRPSSLKVSFEVRSLSRGSDTPFLHGHRQEGEGGILLPASPAWQ